MLDAGEPGIVARRDDAAGEPGDQKLRRLVPRRMLDAQVAAVRFQHADRRVDARDPLERRSHPGDVVAAGPV